MDSPKSVVLDSALSRDQFVRVHRLLLRRQSRASPLVIVVLLVIVALVLVVVDSPVLGVSSRAMAAVVGFIAVMVAVLIWRQPYRLWTGQEKLLASEGTLTLDADGVFRMVPGVVEARIPWSSIEATVDGGDVLGLRTSRYTWLMVPLPDDPDAAARAREMLAKHMVASGT